MYLITREIKWKLLTIKTKTMDIEKFIEKHVLPYEDLNLQLEYEKGNMDYDTEYLIERATELGIKLKK